MKKKLLSILLVLSMVLCFSGCDIASWNDNYAEKFLNVNGTKVGITGNVIKESVINSSDGSQSTEYSLSSVVTINVDGKQIQSCGDTVIFEENGLKPDAEFQLRDIESSTDGSFSENTIISGIVN